MKEIGSEFWEIEQTQNGALDFSDWGDDIRYYVSGRTALDSIIKDIKQKKDVFSALLPSYCCHSIILPFVNNNIEVEFYSVDNNMESSPIYADKESKQDIIYLTNYFGFDKSNPRFRKESNTNADIIFDMTHCLLSKQPCIDFADYSYASFRKWTGVSGFSIAVKHNGVFSTHADNKIHSSFVELRELAMQSKAQYLKGRTNNKDEFIKLFKEAEALLDYDYVGYAASKDSIERIAKLPVDWIRQTRRDNFSCLLEEISNITAIHPVFSDIDEGDCPLFLPIIMKAEDRSSLQSYLSNMGVYCPSHWPLSSLHSINDEDKQLYLTELSLICDQRYSVSDMRRIAKLIREWNGC